jgi:hypothetical protein
MSGATGIANSTITAVLQGRRAMRRREIETFAASFHTPLALLLPAAAGRGVAAPPGCRQRPTRGSHVQGGSARAKTKPGTSGRKSVAEERAPVCSSSLNRTAKATFEVLDGERRPPWERRAAK